MVLFIHPFRRVPEAGDAAGTKGDCGVNMFLKKTLTMPPTHNMICSSNPQRPRGGRRCGDQNIIFVLMLVIAFKHF